jgi:hypothetical protein
MCTYNWTEQHPLLHTRAQAQAVCEQLGFRLAPAQSSSRRPQRPRLIGTNQDRTARIELIGPDEVIFKAVLLASRDVQTASDSGGALPLMCDFVHAWLPTWTNGRAWLAAHYALTGTQPSAEVSFGDIVISLRSAEHGAATALSLSYAFFGQEHTRAAAAEAGMPVGS